MGHEIETLRAARGAMGRIFSSPAYPLPSARQHPSYGDCLEVKREYYQNTSMLDCLTQCLQSAAHLYEQFLQVNRLGLSHFDP